MIKLPEATLYPRVFRMIAKIGVVRLLDLIRRIAMVYKVSSFFFFMVSFFVFDIAQLETRVKPFYNFM